MPATPTLHARDSVAEDAPCVVVDGHAYAFPGCRRIHIGRDEIADYDGRIEFWEADTETALMVRSPTTPYHELPTMRLAGLTERIAATRGTDIEVLGASDLLVRDDEGNRHRILQADQIVYTRTTSKRPEGPAVEVEAGELPDVLLEVDLTTDVRRGKLGLYERWGFPEVWVEVPEREAPSGRRRAPGLTIYLLGAEGYLESSASSAFPSWTAVEIHAALNEVRAPGGSISASTATVLRRVGRLMRADTGTGPDDDPFLRDERAEGRAEAIAEGRAQGLVEGMAEGRRQGLLEGEAAGRAEGHAGGLAVGRAQGQTDALLAIFRLRGLYTTRSFAPRVASLSASFDALLRTAYACRNEEDFFRRLGADL